MQAKLEPVVVGDVFESTDPRKMQVRVISFERALLEPDAVVTNLVTKQKATMPQAQLLSSKWRKIQTPMF
jgi:hypothetical protein